MLLSGVGTLVLNISELATLHQHFKLSIRQLLRLPVNTPECFIMLMAGVLPATALVHLRMLGLLGMIGRLGTDGVLNRIGRSALLTAKNPHSWFMSIRSVTIKYGLTDPLLILQQPPTKDQWKRLCKSKVTDWWETHYCGQAAHLTSLSHFCANFSSLKVPHRIMSSAGSPYEVTRAITVTRMLSGRYITCHRTRHWDKSNPTGACRLCPTVPGVDTPIGDLQHQLIFCPALQVARTRAVQLWAAHMVERPHLLPVVSHYTLGTLPDCLAFLLDPSSCPGTINAAQEHGQTVYQDCLYMSRVWCHSNHRLRMKMLKLKGIIK